MQDKTITLDELVDELLSIEKIKINDKPSFLDRMGSRVRSVIKRGEINKAINDELDAQRKKIISIGNSAEAFLNSSYYKQFINEFVKDNVKGGLQRLLRDYESLDECQIKAELAGIVKCLRLVASIKLKVLQGEQEKERLKV